jgi:WD40 repeat protein
LHQRQEIGRLEFGTRKLIGTALEGHSERVNSVVFSPNGTKIVSGSADKTIRVWSVMTQASIGEPLNGHTDVIRSVAFTQDGAFIVSGSYDKTIRVWDIKTGIEACEPLRGHISPVTSVACSPDGVHIVSGSSDQTVRLWDIGDILAKGVIAHDFAEYDVPSLGNTAIRAPSAKGNCTISHPRPNIAVQYPPHLFPHQTFEMQDGWIMGPDDELLLWVPPANRADLLSPSSRSRILGVDHPTELDFSNFKCGTEWTQCREPTDAE